MPSRPLQIPSGTEQPQRRTPPVSVLLASAALLPLLAGTAATLAAPGPRSAAAEKATLAWANAILLFLAGVRRGLAFREPGGPTAAQIATAAGLFLPGLAAMLAPRPRPAAALLAAGFTGIAVLDPLAARRQEAPAFFSRLRPVQAGVATLALLAILLRPRPAR